MNNTIFVDWDDLDANDIKKLRTNISSAITKNNIHTFIDSGFIDNTQVKMLNGTKKPIDKIKIGDLLDNGARVLGIVQLHGDTFRYNIKGKTILGGPNLQYIDDNLGNMISSSIEKIDYTMKKYHLITDTKFLTINSINFYDYNGAIETKLEGEYILFANI